MRTTIGGDVTYETKKQKLNRILKEKQELKNNQDGGSVGSSTTTTTSKSVEAASGDLNSFLWVPGQDEDIDNEIFKL